jgi:DNA (cytosine-5)-methyltransferase 1
MNLQPVESIPIIDLFAGPGGLGEGFSSFNDDTGKKFKIALSIEKDLYAHSTLKLRSFFRQFWGQVPNEYYQFIKGQISLQKLYELFPAEAETADHEAWNAELGSKEPDAPSHEDIDERIRKALDNRSDWILIGGPPCQAYSTMGRSRNKAIKGYIPEKDTRHFLYKEYLRIIASHWPTIFVMENVRGILSSRLNGEYIFPKLLNDLQDPASVFTQSSGTKTHRYRLFSFVKNPDFFDHNNFPIYNKMHSFTIKCEEYRIPQARHRVILLGVREDVGVSPSTLEKRRKVSVSKVIGDFPRLRSGLSGETDSPTVWRNWIAKILDEKWIDDLIEDKSGEDVLKRLFYEIQNIRNPKADRGGEYVCCTFKTNHLPHWYHDPRIGGLCNHSSRAHMETDLYRYFFAACFAKERKRSPILRDFPKELIPDHKSAPAAVSSRNFADRFRVQLSSKPATTIMSHISKDGHYYIHYDPTQCRSLSVREAARLQTFPDNYFFCGSRTQQYIQVGNAVPPFLAVQIAGIVYAIIRKKWQDENGHADKRET